MLQKIGIESMDFYRFPLDLGGFLACGRAPKAPIEGETLQIKDISDCNLRQGARHLKGTYKGDLFTYFLMFFFVC